MRLPLAKDTQKVMAVELSDVVLTGDGDSSPLLCVRVDPLYELPFSQLLQWTQSLRNHHYHFLPESTIWNNQKNNFDSEKTVSLRSLVSIHKSVIQALLESNSVREPVADHPERQSLIVTVNSESLDMDFPDVWESLFCSPDDKNILHRLWSTIQSDLPLDLDAQRLLLVQYGLHCIHPVVPSCNHDELMNREDSLSHRLALLRVLVLPLCLSQDACGTGSTGVNVQLNDSSVSFCNISGITDDLLDAMLDAVLTYDASIEDRVVVCSTNPSNLVRDESLKRETCRQEQWLKSCLDYVVGTIRLRFSLEACSSKNSVTHFDQRSWSFACHIVRRLANALGATTYPDVVHAVATLSILSVEFVALLGNRFLERSNECDIERSILLSKILRPLIIDLLPVLTDALGRDVCSKQSSISNAVLQVRQFWSVLWNHYNDDVSRQHQSNDMNDHTGSYLQQPWSSSTSNVSSMTTSILCLLLPSVLHTALPVSFSSSFLDSGFATTRASTSSYCIPIFHRNLWEMVLRCLRLGLSYHVDHRGRRRRTVHGRFNSANFTNKPDTVRMHQLHRRRGLYILHLLVENLDPSDESILPSQFNDMTYCQNQKGAVVLWRKYVACYETLEMETDQHLIDQVWETVTDLFDHMIPSHAQNSLQSNALCTFPESVVLSLPLLTWDWMQLLLGRVLVSQDSPVIRKLSLFRLFKGQAGVTYIGDDDNSIKGLSDIVSPTKNKSQRKTKAKPRGASLHVIDVDFLFTVVLFSFDTLLSSVGTNMQATASVLSHSGFGGNRSQVAVSEEMIPLLCKFFGQYVRLLLVKSNKAATNDLKIFFSGLLEQFFRRLWSADVLDGVHHKVTVSIFESICSTLLDYEGENCGSVPVHDDMLQMVSESFQLAFSDGSMVTAYKDSLLRSLAVILRFSRAVGKHNPKSILSVLTLYPSRMLDQLVGGDESAKRTSFGNPTSHFTDPLLKSLSTWLIEEATESKSGINVGATVATAFVDGLMSRSLNNEIIWDPKFGCTNTDRKFAKAITLFCILPNTAECPSTAGEQLWPAIHKGVSHASVVLIGNNMSRAGRVARALLLLEYGVRFCALSGLGNGDLVVDQKTQNMLPPVQKVDSLLGSCVNFILFQVKSLLTVRHEKHGNDKEVVEISGNPSRSSDARVLSMTFARLVSQLQYLTYGFPSSQAIGPIVNSALKESVDLLWQAERSIDSEKHSLAGNLALLYITLASGGEMDIVMALSTTKALLHIQFDNGFKMFGQTQALRSVFQFSKWGALSKLLPKILESKTFNGINLLIDDVFDLAVDAIEATPSTALVPLFDSVVVVANARYVESIENQKDNVSQDEPQFSKVIATLLDLVDGCGGNVESIYMIDKICTLLFQPTLLLQEYQKLQENVDAETPIRDAFRRLVKMSRTDRPHISRIFLSRACAGWLMCGKVGVPGIPYRDDIVKLLVHKEEIVPAASSFSPGNVSNDFDGILLGQNTDETCVSRGFLLVFLSKLPDIGNDLSPCVLKELLQYTILKLVNMVALAPTSSSGLIMYGTSEYCVKIRALQALCVMSRFITVEIADAVCTSLFQAMGKQTSHNQIRYFLEVLTLQFARMHGSIFVNSLVQQIRRTDLSLQMVASLMIISGNLIVGRYKEDFFRQCSLEHVDSHASAPINIHAILAGVIPWLSSTQGFSRAIAQLLTFQLIPLVIPNLSYPPLSNEDSDWYLRSVYRFLEENPEMKRLRRKQEQFFDRYEVDSVCTPEGVFAIPVDESHEANPVHMIDVIKECLQEVYDEGSLDRAPLWKQIEMVVNDSSLVDDSLQTSGHEGVNFQRKIIPIDELNLTLDSLSEQKHRNLAGRIKQKLIVCATLIDKVPNLGGLARTCEIFALDRLVVPDLQITKMDNFKNLCVGAGDWIEMEECSKANLLSWLQQKSSEGFHIVGLEQTLSSASLLDYHFPNTPSQRGTILLLGKEKEGIPVEYIDVVDQCIEIPQYGIIRSLNVHVSGAIAIWEYTKQQQRRRLPEVNPNPGENRKK